jgi:urease accessory protein
MSLPGDAAGLDPGAGERSLAVLGRSRELASYQDEPRQMRSGAVGKTGLLRMGFEHRRGRTTLAVMERQVPLMVQRPLYWDEALPDMACIMIIHTSGSVLQGDRFHVRIDVGPGASAHVTTQAATKIHEMDANYAAQLQDITVASGGYLEYLPGLTIPHRHSRYLSNTLVTLPADATMLLSETVMPGRKYHRDGEVFQYDVFSSTVQAQRPDGTQLFTEKLLVEPPGGTVRALGAMGGYDVFGTVFALTSAEHIAAIMERTEPVFEADGVVSGASRLPNDAGVVLRVLGSESGPVRRRIREFWGVVRQTVVGVPVPEAFLWE